MAGSRQHRGRNGIVAQAGSTADIDVQCSTAWYCCPVRLFGFTMILLAAFSCAATANDEAWLQPPANSAVDHGSFYSSLLTRHQAPEADHNDEQNLLGYETRLQNRYLLGFAMLDNAAGEDSQYAYLGREYRAFESDRWYYKLTGGLRHDFDEPGKDEISLNDLDAAPTIIPGIGYQYKNFNAEFVQIDLDAGMITLGLSF